MKRLLLITFMALSASLAVSQEKFAEITFAKSSHDFGNITEGASVTYEFEFSNTGNSTLVITDVTKACGCTTPDWPTKPIMPGEKSKIKVVFNSTGKSGQFSKTITVNSNAKTKSAVLTITGNVQAK